MRAIRDVLARRAGTFDIEAHALRPVVDIARWTALSVGSPELSTRGRLAAAGSQMIPDEQAHTLIELFDVLQQLRLSDQAHQVERGDAPTDVMSMHRLSPLDRSLISQAVREITTVQHRMATVAQVTPPDSW